MTASKRRRQSSVKRAPAAAKVHAMIEKTINRDPEGRFERHGKALSKTQKKKKQTNKIEIGLREAIDFAKSKGINKQENNRHPVLGIGSGKAGPGRPKGSKNKTSAALREQILAALDRVGGEQYLATLAIENSSAFAGLLGKVLPSTLAMPETSGGAPTVSFERIIVWPDGHREVEGVTPKQLPSPGIAQLPGVGEKPNSGDEQA